MTGSTTGTNSESKNPITWVKEKWYCLLGKYDGWAKISEWEGYVNVYKQIANVDTRSGAQGVTETGIQFVAGHLDILDRKFGILVTFQGLMATIVAIYIGASLPHPVTHLPGRFKAFAYVWLVTTLLCLSGMAWVRWGDLGRKSGLKTPAECEQKHVWSLLRSFRFRSLLFKWAVVFTAIGILSLILAVSLKDSNASSNGKPPEITVPSSDGKPPKTAGPPSVTKPIGMVGPFTTGVGCSTNPLLAARIADTVSNIQRDKVSGVLIVGRGDAVPISNKLAHEFGNNTGLALTRDRCVAGWLTEVLGTNNIHVEMKFSVDDAAERSPEAREHGNVADRFVQVLPTDYRQ